MVAETGAPEDLRVLTRDPEEIIRETAGQRLAQLTEEACPNVH